LPGEHIPSPLEGDDAKWQDGVGHWLTPDATQAIGCTGCHDNGGFIRSEYLAQLRPPPGSLPTPIPNHVFPNQEYGFNNFDTPSRYVGFAYETNRSWSIETSLAPGDPGPLCTSCHRLAVPNRKAFAQINGTAAHFANVATAEDQCIDSNCSKTHPHNDSSPIWMRKGQVHYDPTVESSATKYKECAVAFFNSNFTSAPPGCTVRLLGEPLPPPAPLCPTEVQANTNLNELKTTFKWLPPPDVHHHVDHLNINRNGVALPSGPVVFPDGTSILPSSVTSVTIPFDQDYLATYNICAVAIRAKSCCTGPITPTRTLCVEVAKCRVHGRVVLPTDTDDPKTWCSDVGGRIERFLQCSTSGGQTTSTPLH